MGGVGNLRFDLKGVKISSFVYIYKQIGAVRCSLESKNLHRQPYWPTLVLENRCQPPCLTPTVEVWDGWIGSTPTSFIGGERCLYSLKKNPVRHQQTFLDDPLPFRCALKKKASVFSSWVLAFNVFYYSHGFHHLETPNANAWKKLCIQTHTSFIFHGPSTDLVLSLTYGIANSTPPTICSFCLSFNRAFMICLMLRARLWKKVMARIERWEKKDIGHFEGPPPNRVKMRKEE